ncbi:MAG: hypothetical protein NZL99_04065 [Burkholderiaceae bacterium]|nr:hypothetical protein [Burkholderiaceae bacterium]
MFLGHYAAAVGAKALVPRVSLGTLTFAAILADLLFALFSCSDWSALSGRLCLPG